MSIAIRRVHPSEFGHDTHIPPGYSRSRPCEFRPATTTLDDGTRIDLVLVESPVIVRDSLIHFDDDPELGAIAVDVSHRDGVVTRAVIDAADMSHFAVLARRECPRLSQKELRDCVIAAAVQDAVDLVGHPLRVRM